MSVSFQTHQSGDKTVVSAIGRIDSSNASEFETALFEVLDKGPTGGVAVDFSKLDYISSAGLRVVLMGAKRQMAAKAPFAVCGLSENIQKVFSIGGFERIVSIYPTVEDIPSA